MPIRAVVADDERPARAFLVTLLQRFPGVTIAAEAADGTEAIHVIQTQVPDVAFLDLQMPDVDGLAVLDGLKRRHRPLVVIVTAYDDQAVKAFDLNAVDYITKPATEARLGETLRRVRERLESVDDVDEPAAAGLSDAVNASHPWLDRIPIRLRHEILVVPVSQLVSAVSEGELLHLTTIAQGRHTITHRLKNLEARLDPQRFLRLDRGALVNIDMIATVTPLSGGRFIVRLKNRQEHNVSRMQARLLRRTLLHL